MRPALARSTRARARGADGGRGGARPSKRFRWDVSGRRCARGLALLGLLVTHLLGRPGVIRAEPCVDALVAFTPGTNGGFQSDLLPDIVLGPPFGEGVAEGSLDVVSFGDDGSMTVAFEDNMIIDGPGVDFTIFENAFGDGVSQATFIEVGIVSVSADGATFFEMPFDSNSFVGLAGVTPVASHPDNAIDPRDPTVSGGDAFDLADVGLASARFVRIDDPGATVADPGNDFPTPGPGQSGFDLDAIVAVNSVDTCAACCDVDDDGTITPGDVLLLLLDVLDQPLAIQPCGDAPCRSVHCGDIDDSGGIGPTDVLLCQQLASELSTAIAPCATGLCDFEP